MPCLVEYGIRFVFFIFVGAAGAWVGRTRTAERVWMNREFNIGGK